MTDRSQPSLSSMLTAVSLGAFALTVGTPVVLAAVPFWEGPQIELGQALGVGRLLSIWLVTVSTVGTGSGLAAIVASRSDPRARGSAILATGLNTVPALWLLAIGLLW